MSLQMLNPKANLTPDQSLANHNSPYTATSLSRTSVVFIKVTILWLSCVIVARANPSEISSSCYLVDKDSKVGYLYMTLHV